MAKFDTIIKNGKIVTPAAEFAADLGIKDGKIVAIAEGLEDGKKVIDATGKLVMPGGVDIHTHLDTPLNGSVTLDDWYYGTVSAACGGVTCVVDYPKQEVGHSVRDIIEKWKGKAAGKSVVDYSFSPVITQYNEEVYEEIPKLIEEGFPGYKVFMAYWHRIPDEELIRMLDVVSSNGGILGIHCENDWAADYLIKKLLDEGKTEPKYFPMSRPPLIEEEATSRAIALANLVDANVFIVHMSAKGAIEAARKARAKKNNVVVETCDHFIAIDERVYDQPLEEACKYVVTPPLRSQEHIDAIWQGIINGDIDLVSSDHCAFPYADKVRLGKENFSTIPHGAPAIETRLPIMFSEGVSKGRITASRFVELVSANPAKVAGLYPKKGTIAIGSDADICIMDPNKEVIISGEMLHTRCDFCPYEGIKVKGYPVMTISRGTVLYDDGQVLAERGHGQLVWREKFKPLG